MSRNHESSLDDVLAKPGVEQLDYLAANVQASSVLGEDAQPNGLAASLLHGRVGEQIDAIGNYVPGQDAVHNIDIRNTMATGRTMARKVLASAAPANVHVLLDMPARFESLTGDYSAQKYGSFMLALCGRVADETGSDVVVYHNNGESAGQIYDGQAGDLYMAYRQIETGHRRADARRASLDGILSNSEEFIDTENDAVVVVSDFLGGYDKKNGSFDWEQPLARMSDALGDRLWVARVTSPAQKAAAPMVGNTLLMPALQGLNSEFSGVAEAKDQLITQRLEQLRTLQLDTVRDNNDVHPVRAIRNFLLGQPKEA